MSETAPAPVTEPAVDPTCKKINETIEVVVTIDLALGWNRWRADDTEHSFNERQAVLAERAAKEFREFLRDHRSQDENRLDVRRITEERCSECHKKWETDKPDGYERCAWCGYKVSQ